MIQEELEHRGYLPVEAEKERESSDAESEKLRLASSYSSSLHAKQFIVNTDESEIVPQTSCQEDNWRLLKMKLPSLFDQLKFLKEQDRVARPGNPPRPRNMKCSFMSTPNNHMLKWIALIQEEWMKLIQRHQVGIVEEWLKVAGTDPLLLNLF